jgi:hypothetical protein
MKKIFVVFYFLLTVGCHQITEFLNEDSETLDSEISSSPQKNESKNITIVRDKLNSYSEINRVEIRNYVKNAQHPYQSEISLIKKIKTHLATSGKKYLELNFFTNELDPKAPLVAQFILIDEKTKNVLEESSLNLNNSH